MDELLKGEEEPKRGATDSCFASILGLAFLVGESVGKGFTPFLRHPPSPSMRGISRPTFLTLLRFAGRGHDRVGVTQEGRKTLPYGFSHRESKTRIIMEQWYL